MGGGRWEEGEEVNGLLPFLLVILTLSALDANLPS